MSALHRLIADQAMDSVRDWPRDQRPARKATAVDLNVLKHEASSLTHLFGLPGGDMTLQLTVRSGVQFIVPLYDRNWAVGSGWPLARLDGDMYVIGTDGFSSSGFGFYLSSPKEALISVLPHGTFTGSWGSFQTYSRLRGRLGTGVVVHDGSTAVISHQPVVWDVISPQQGTSQRFDLPYADTATPPPPNSFGPLPLAPQIFHAQPGHEYLVWFYLWQLGTGFKDAAMISMAQAKVPLVSVISGPVPIVH